MLVLFITLLHLMKQFHCFKKVQLSLTFTKSITEMMSNMWITDINTCNFSLLVEILSSSWNLFLEDMGFHSEQRWYEPWQTAA